MNCLQHKTGVCANIGCQIAAVTLQSAGRVGELGVSGRGDGQHGDGGDSALLGRGDRFQAALARSSAGAGAGGDVVCTVLETGVPYRRSAR
jgi:hypothetical protein